MAAAPAGSLFWGSTLATAKPWPDPNRASPCGARFREPPRSLLRLIRRNNATRPPGLGAEPPARTLSTPRREREWPGPWPVTGRPLHRCSLGALFRRAYANREREPRPPGCAASSAPLSQKTGRARAIRHWLPLPGEG